MTNDQAQFIDELREASKQYGCVYDLLLALEGGLLIDGNGNKEVIAEGEDLEVINAALLTVAFAKLDRQDKS